jgi:predicted O-methyltransferase YrrM
MDKLENYITDHTSAEQEVLRELNRETHVKVLFPRMMSGHLQGKFLQMVSWMIRPGRVLEIGTYTGYSAICLAGGLKDQGVVHTIEINPELEDIILKYVVKAGLSDKIQLHIGDAIDIIPDLDETFDLVFIDADKENYLNYYHLVFDKVREGGFILADNALWDGKVVEEKKRYDKETEGIIKFNDFVQNDDRVENVLLPVRDGIMIIRKTTPNL